MLKLSKIKTLAAISMALAVCACTTTPPPPAPQKTYQQTDISKFISKVIVVDEQPSTVVYEYHDLRVDEVALLAAMYCQDHGNRHAYLENVILYQNNNRRARFYCSSR